MKKPVLPFLFFLLFGEPAARAQGYVDQAAVRPLLDAQDIHPDAAPVHWHLFTFPKTDKTGKAAERRLRAHLDSLPGAQRGQRVAIVELSNRVRRAYFHGHRTLLVPDSFPEDFRAYAPYPFRYPGADTLPRLFVIDKETQTFGAYEGGRLVRWGLVSTGADDYLTPPGRYAFNWRQEVRQSSEAPEGEVWEMRWVWNFHGPNGIHVHQYALPISKPASHGCVRLTEADAEWNFHWAERGTTVLVINSNPADRAAHWLPADGGPFSLVRLPEAPIDVPPGVPDEGMGPESRKALVESR